MLTFNSSLFGCFMRFPKEKKVKVRKMSHSLTKFIRQMKNFVFIVKNIDIFVRNCLKNKNDEKEKANQACENQEHIFVVALSVNDHTTYDSIIDSNTTQHMTFKR
jgi:hypothetical protein